MALNTVEKIISDELKTQNTVFVFSSQTSVNRWIERATEISGFTAIAKERFMAWDEFKENSIRSKHQEKKPIPSTLRKMFACKLIKNNAENPFLSYFICRDFAKDAQNFSSWIAQILPSLALWKKYVGNEQNFDEQDKDLNEIYQRYSDFLEKNGLFEQAWETPPFESDGNKYIIFFPEILSDYEEYKTILESSPDIRLVKVDECELSKDVLEKGCVQFFSNSRIEIKNACLFLRKMHEEQNIDWLDMAVSITDIDSYSAYVMRDFDLFQIPYVSRHAKPLASSGAGILFQNLSECVSGNFAYDSIRNLVLNNELPWNDVDAIQQLIEFGQKNHCICSFEGKDGQIDIWEESLKEYSTEEKVKNFYESLKKLTTKMVSAKSFEEIRTRYFEFRETFFDLSLCSKKTDNILSRCISELSALIDLEKNYEDLSLDSPFSFFCQILSEKKYLEQSNKKGVSILDYKLSATAPFKVQLILNASQNGTSVVYKRLPFLLDNKRKKLFNNATEQNVSELFIKLYMMHSANGNFMFSASERTFTDYSQPVSYLEEINRTKSNDIQDIRAADLFWKEKNWFLNDNDDPSINMPAEFFQSQRESLNAWLEEGTIDFSENVLDTTESDGNNKKLLTISQSKIKDFYECPRKYMFKRYLKIEEESSEAELLDTYALGNVLHKIFELFLSKLKKDNKQIYVDENKELSQDHKNLLDWAVEKAILFEDDHNNKNCYIMKQIFQTGLPSLKQRALSVVTDFSIFFNGFLVYQVEKELKCRLEKTNILMEGKADCILLEPSTNELFLIDFKTSDGGFPKKPYFADRMKNSEWEKENDLPFGEQILNDFQMPYYIYLFANDVTNTNNAKIENCAFFSMKELRANEKYTNRLKPIAGEGIFNLRTSHLSKEKTESVTIEDFEIEINKTLEFTRYYADCIANNNFEPNKRIQNFEKCKGCEYKSICRTTFNVGKTKLKEY